MRQDGLIQVRAQLCERIDGLRAQIPYGSVSGLCEKASDVRHFAQRHDLRPIADLAWKLEGRLARGERGPSVIDVLCRMREATEDDPPSAAAH